MVEKRLNWGRENADHEAEQSEHCRGHLYATHSHRSTEREFATEPSTGAIGAIGLFAPARSRGIVVVSSEVRVNATIRRLWVMLMDSRGAGMVEYALLVALIALALIVAVTGVGTGLFNSFSGSAEAVDGIIT